MDRTFSPITAGVAQHLRKIAARAPRRRDDVFAKVGDSVTYSGNSLRCFAEDDVDLRTHSELEPTLQRFREGDAGGTDPFRRHSVAARMGWSAWKVLRGTTSPLERELEQTSARYALVQFGTNDIELNKPHHFADSLLDIVDELTERGVVPVLYTIMPRRDSHDAAARVPLYNGIIRVVAQARQVPLVDYHRELDRLPRDGMGDDGIHPAVYRGAQGRDPCALTPEALRKGYNLRNLLTLEALHRISRVLDDHAAPLDDLAPGLAGAGSAEQPLEIDAAFWIDQRELRKAPRSQGRAGGCGAGRGPSERAWVYAIELAERSLVHIVGFDRGAQADLHLMREQEGQLRCVRGHPLQLLATVPAGRYRLVVDSQEPQPPANAQVLLVGLTRPL